MYYVSRIAGIAALAALGVAVWYSIVLARADFYYRRATPESVERATEIAPRNTEYLALRALQLEYDGGDARALREKIAALNPYSSAPRIRLGLAAEVAGDEEGAERWLLDAARVDHQFEPRWTLANFYFRAGNKTEFWKWMRAALEVSYGDRTPAYELCWRVSSDGGEILERAIPDRREVVVSYLVYLLTKKPGDGRAGIFEAARRVAGFHEAGDLPVLLSACDELIRAGDAAAVEVWAFAGQSAPKGIFNGDFASEPLQHGFDWRLIASPGVTHATSNRVALSGLEAESVSLLEQVLSVEEGKKYKLLWEARTEGIKDPSGIAWRVAGEHAALRPSEDWAAGEMTFSAEKRFEVLELAYQRPVGESRAEGSVELRHIRLVAQ